MESREGVVEGSMNKLSGANMDIDLSTPANQVAGNRINVPGTPRKALTIIAALSRTFPFVHIFAGWSTWTHCYAVTLMKTHTA